MIKTFYDEQENLISDIEHKIDATDEQRDQYNEKIDKLNQNV